MKCKKLLFVSLFLLPLLVSCGGNGGSDSSRVEPEIHMFTVSPAVADPMTTVTLAWDTDAESVEISGFGAVPPSGSREITADTSKVFTIIARVRDIVRTAQANLTVRPRVDPPPGPGPGPTPHPACSDGVDNDGDGRVDLLDPGCTDALDTNEADLIPPPQEACEKKPGVQVAGGDNFFYNNGMEGLRVFGENKTYFIKNKSNLDDTYSWLEFCEQGAGELGFLCTVLAEYAHGGTGGGIQYTYDIGSDGSIHLVWWRVGASTPPFETKAYLVSRLFGSTSWFNPVELPYPFTIPYSLPKLKVSGSNIYLFDQPDFGRTSITMIRRVGWVWQPAREIYQNLNAAVQLTSAQADASGRVYVFFTEAPERQQQYGHRSLATSTDQGTTWHIERVHGTADNGRFQWKVAPDGTIYALHFNASFVIDRLESSTNFLSWGLVTNIPSEISSRFDSYTLHLRNGGFTILGLAKLCGASTRTIRRIERADYVDGAWTRKTVQALDTNGGDSPSFSGAVTPEGTIYTFLSRNVAGASCGLGLCPTELWLGRDP